MVVHQSPPGEIGRIDSILRYAESLQGFTEIKSTHSWHPRLPGEQLRINAWSTFVLRVEHPYIVGKLYDFTEHYIIKSLSARELVLPPWVSP